MKRILVTGVPRSGTTFTGRLLDLSKETTYIWEPFNRHYRRIIPDYYPYVGRSSPEEKARRYKEVVEHTVHFRSLSPNINIKQSDSLAKKTAKRLGVNRAFLLYAKARLNHFLRPNAKLLVKDPIAIFLTKFLVEVYDFTILAIVRHPAAVHSSRHRLNWDFDFTWWQEQRDLCVDYIEPFFGELPKAHDRVTGTSVHWKVCYSFLAELKKQYPGKVFFLRHEALCASPLQEFEKLYSMLGVPMTDSIRNRIVYNTTGKNIEKRGKSLSSLERRDSRSLAFKWKRDISETDLHRIRQMTSPISAAFYDDDCYWRLN